MGDVITCRCSGCSYNKNISLGSGFNFPKIYSDTVNKMKNGVYGNEAQSFFLDNPYGAIDCEYTAARCSGCGELKSVMALTMYVPKDVKKVKRLRRKKRGFWSFAYPGRDDDYVDVKAYDTKDLYAEYGKYKHTCSSCGSPLELLPDFRNRILRGDIKCPKCGSYLVLENNTCWD